MDQVRVEQRRPGLPRVVATWKMPRDVSLVEYNRYKFDVELTEEDGFSFRGLRFVKKASFRRTSRFQVDKATAFIARRRTEEGKEGLLEELRRTHAALINI